MFERTPNEEPTETSDAVGNESPPALANEPLEFEDPFSTEEEASNPEIVPAPVTSAASDESGLSLESALAEYRMVRRIAEHANTAVFKAEDQTKGRLVIIKVVYAPGTDASRKTAAELAHPASALHAAADEPDSLLGAPLPRREAAWPDRIAGRDSEIDRLLHFRHPFISSLLDVRATQEGHLIFTSEFVKGTPILEFARNGKLSLTDRLNLFARVCECVGAIHQRCMVHRDLRPTNILVNSKAEVRLVGLGVAAITGVDLGFASNPVSEHEAELFYPYRSPEQVRGDALEVDIRSDVYALGAVLYEMLLACKPCDLRAGPSGDIFRAIVEGSPIDPSTRDRSIPAGVRTILMKALAKAPEHRYESATAMGHDLRSHLGNRPLSGAGAVRRGGSRTWRILLPFAAAVACAALTFGKPWLAKSFGDPPRRSMESSRMAAALAAVAELKSKLQATEKLLADEKVVAESARERIKQTKQGQAQEVARLEERLQEAEATQKKADSRAARAEQEVARALGISEFLMSAFEATPDGSGGKSGRSVTEVLARAAELAGPRFAADPGTEATILSFLASAWQGMGRIDQAVGLLRRAVELRARALGETHEDTVATMDRVANLLFAQAKFEECEEISRRLVEASRRAFGAQDARTLTSLNNLGRAVHAGGDLEGAESLFRDALEGRKKEFGEDDLKTAMSAHDLAVVLFERGNMSEAAQLLRRSLAAFKDSLPADHPLHSTTRAYLGGALLALGRYDQAEPLLLEAHASFRAALGEEHPFARTVRDRLISMYTLWNKPVEAAKWKTAPTGQVAAQAP